MFTDEDVQFKTHLQIPIRFQSCLIDPGGNNTKSETGIYTMSITANKYSGCITIIFRRHNFSASLAIAIPVNSRQP